MTRVRKEKEYQEKKRQIINQAVELLSELGYEEFSLNKVIKKAGLTKGAFFHYFESKQELIDGIINLLLVPMVEEFNKIADDDSLLQKDKIHKMFETGYSIKGTDTRETQQLIMLLGKPENELMLQMITAGIIEECTSIYEKVFTEGNKKGQFNIPHPNGSAYLFMNMLVAVNKEIGKVVYKKQVDPKELEALRSKVEAFEQFAKDLLGLSDGERLYSDKMLRADLK